jgi:hypothetical protein
VLQTVEKYIIYAMEPKGVKMAARATGQFLLAATVLVGLSTVACTAAESGLQFPGAAPGEARGVVGTDEFVLENSVISCAWSFSEGRLKPKHIRNKPAGTLLQLWQGECFVLVAEGGRQIKASDLEIAGRPDMENLRPKDKSARLAERHGGKRVTARLRSSDGSLDVVWRATLRDGSNYVRQELELRNGKQAAGMKEIASVDVTAADANVAGTVDGSPVVAGNVFFACEHPLAKCRILQQDPRHLRCGVTYSGMLEGGERIVQSSVAGVVPPGQLRRGFLYYVERERAHPYRPFLHYNSWYDIGYGAEKIQQQGCRDVIELFGEELIRRRQVVMDSFALDDGWDDTGSLWRFHGGFPKGFSPLREVAAKYDCSLGAWLSPWGGYGQAKEERLKYGRAQGFETNEGGFSLAGPKYYSRFRDVCAGMVRDYGLNYFKFDGIGAGGRPAGANRESARDIMALLRLVGELRTVEPDLFVNITTGTWPSPYWLWYGDSIWRAGADWSTYGWGSKRQQQITYRDKETYQNVVVRAPLYPLNSLMTQGVMFANHGLASEADGLAEDILAFFGSGTNCQELYITASLMGPRAWDVLAEAARWSRDNADVLVDTHWVGGDPAKGEVYGWASWSRRKGILCLRNPHEKSGKVTLDIGKAFELPDGAPRAYLLKSPWRKDAGRAAILVSAGAAHAFELKPFEVLVYDATVR